MTHTRQALRAAWAFICLLGALARRQVKRVLTLGADDGGPARFLDNYAHEGLHPMSAADERFIEALGRCIHCGVCEAVCPEPADRWLAFSRATAMAQVAAVGLPEAPCAETCAACAAACPVGVPVDGVVAYLRGRAGY